MMAVEKKHRRNIAPEPVPVTPVSLPRKLSGFRGGFRVGSATQVQRVLEARDSGRQTSLSV
jgi:hypothetical protein